MSVPLSLRSNSRVHFGGVVSPLRTHMYDSKWPHCMSGKVFCSSVSYITLRAQIRRKLKKWRRSRTGRNKFSYRARTKSRRACTVVWAAIRSLRNTQWQHWTNKTTQRCFANRSTSCGRWRLPSLEIAIWLKMSSKRQRWSA